MNSYPPEFLAHPQPLMFVAGLTPSSSERSTSSAPQSSLGSQDPGLSPTASSSSHPRSRSGSTAATASLEAPSTHSAGALTTPVSSPQPRPRELTLSPPQSGLEVDADPVEGVEEDGEEDEFDVLRRHLRESLAELGKRNRIWLRNSQRRDFRVMLVDKGIRLPLRKVNPSTSGAQSPSAIPHSPLSPHTPTSPLYPDGLLAPIWVKKHAEIVPAVFVMFLRLYETPTSAKSPSEAEYDAAARARKEAEKAMEKDADEGLVQEIAERRRRLGERGIKLTVVLMASAAALDSPSLDARLSYLRRASQLSSKASLFVLSPVPADQLPEFVRSLQDALYDPALEYYNQHAKRVKRKRSRLPASGSTTPSALQGQAKGLPPQGWIVRYEWKAGWFAEIRGEVEEARRHYEDCWNELARMFASTQILPPRTKRWAEAKVLADCVAMRICRLLLYADEGSKVLGPFFIHLKRFGDYSRGWGIGEDTFEFWSWIARQYRIFAELLELGVQSGMRIPRIAPPIFPSAQSAISPPTLADLASPISSSNPLHILQTPAYYFYTAALCSVQRRERFQEALATESLEASVAAGYSATVSPGYDNEKKVDHSALIVELYTKAYSLFKEQEGVQNRTALYVAYRIAETYCSADQHELAIRFFERISPTFKNDKWTPIVRQIRELWYTCAQRTGHVEHAARLLIEMMSPDSGIEGEERVALQDDLLSLMKTTSPAGADPIVVASSADSPLISVTVAYWLSRTHIAASFPIQIALRCPETSHLGNLHFESLAIAFSGSLERPDCIVKAGESDEAESSQTTSTIDIGDIASHGASGFSAGVGLKWRPGSTLLLHGTLTSDRAGQISVDNIRLRLAHGSWTIDLEIPVVPTTTWQTTGGQLSIASTEHASFLARPYDVALTLLASKQVYVGEETSITVAIHNKDDRDVRVSMLPFLEGSSETDDSTLQVVHAPEKGMHGYDLGILPARKRTLRDLKLLARQIGSKRVDLAVRVSSADATASVDDVEDAESGFATVEEHNAVNLEQSADIEAYMPFDFVPHVSYGPVKRSEEGNTCAVMVTASLVASSPSPVSIKEIKLVEDTVPNTRLTWSSLDHIPFAPDSADDTPVNESIGARFLISGPADRVSLESTTALSPAHLEVAWRSSSQSHTTTLLPFPPLSFPTQNAFINAHVSHPTTVQNQHPFRLSLTINNSNPTQSMTGLVMQVDLSDSFVWHGERTTRLPTINPDSSEDVHVVLVPVVGKAGTWELPRVRVYHPQRMQLEREEIRVDGTGSVEVRP